MGHLVLVDHLSLLHLLDSNNLLSLFVPAHSDFTKSTSANDLERVEIPNSNFGSPAPIMLVNQSYDNLNSSASLCWISCLIRSFSVGERFILSICFNNLSHATQLLQDKETTFLLFLLLVLELGVLAFDVGFGSFCLLSGDVCGLEDLLIFT